MAAGAASQLGQPRVAVVVSDEDHDPEHDPATSLQRLALAIVRSLPYDSLVLDGSELLLASGEGSG